MADVGQRIQVDCQPLSGMGVPADLQPPAGSCGLDFWQSAPAILWLGRFLHAEPALITIQDGARRAGLCCLLRRLPFGAVLASAYPYAAVTGDEGLFWQNGAAVAAALRAKWVLRLELPFSGEFAVQLTPSGNASTAFKPAPALNAVRHVLDLRPAAGKPNWLENQLAPNTRWAIRKSERVGAKIRLAAPGDLDAVQAIYAATMRSKHAPVNYGPERFRGMLEDLSEAGLARIYLGEVDGRPAGLAGVLDGKASRHLIQLAVLPTGQAARLGDLLVATAIRDAIVQGQSYFDFMASNPRDAGLVAYKAKWATQAEAIEYAVLRVNPLLDYVIDLGRWLRVQRAKLGAYWGMALKRPASRDKDE